MLRAVDQRHGHPHQSDAVGDRVMEAQHHGRPALIVLDDMHGPERVVGIEPLGGEVADEALERLLAAASRQPCPLHMVGEIEIVVVAPIDAGRRILDLLAKAPVAQQPLGDLFLDLFGRDGPLEQP